jgi:serine/threonine protein kinase
MPLEQIAPLVEQICNALQDAHNQGVIHRDIKPSNILLDKNNRVLVADFGLAAIVGGNTQLTGEGEILGTPDYMAPEQIDGSPVDPRTDIYSVGVLVYEMVTGHLPYQAETPFKAMLKRVTELPTSPRLTRPELPVEVEAAILKAMAHEPQDRFPDIQTFWQELKIGLQTRSRKRDRKMPLQAGDVMANGRYRIIKSLGQGAWGIVYLAQDTRLGRDVALKLLQEKIARDPKEMKRFRREPKITARIGTHPNIVSVHDFVEDDEGISYIVMEYVDGGSLRDYLLTEQKNLQSLDFIRFGEDICHALDAIHEKNILHLDLKPGNIMLKMRRRRLTAKVSDFGNAIIHSNAPVDKLDEPTPSGYPRRGTLVYASPEQLSGQPENLDSRADLYAVGAILYEVATGCPPFPLDNPKPLVLRISQEVPLLPTQHNPFLSKPVEEVILRALQKRPEDRFSSAEEMLKALEQAKREAQDSLSRFEVYFNEAKLNFERGDWNVALVKFEALPPARSRVWQEKAEQYIQDCRRFMKLDADYQHAQQARNDKEWAREVELLREVIQVAPDYLDGQANLELDKALTRLEAYQEYQKGLDYAATQDWELALEQLYDITHRFPEFTKEGESLEEIHDEIVRIRRMKQLDDLLQTVEAQTQMASATMAPETWQEVAQTYQDILRLAPDGKDYRSHLKEAERQVQLATFYRQGTLAMEADDWVVAVAAFQRIRQIDRGYCDAMTKLSEAEDRLQCQRWWAETEADLTRQDWGGAREKLERIVALLPDYEDAAPLLAEVETWLAVLADEAQQAWLTADEKLQALTHPSFVELKVEKSVYLRQRADLAEKYKIGLNQYQTDQWRQARQKFREINDIDSNYADVPQLLGELGRRARLDQAARWLARYPKWSLGISMMMIVVLAAGSIYLYRAVFPSASLAPQLQNIEIWVDGKKIDPDQQIQAPTDKSEVVIAVKGFDAGGNPIPADRLHCDWQILSSTSGSEPDWGHHCVINYTISSNSNLIQQSLLVDVTQKGSNELGSSIIFSLK